MITLNTKYATSKLSREKMISKYQKKVNKIVDKLDAKTALGCHLTGWQHPNRTTKAVLEAMKKQATIWKTLKIEHVVIIGIGGSYVGVKGAVDMVNFDETQRPFKLHFIPNMSPDLTQSVMNQIGKDKFGIVIISKSGVTLEPAVSFNLFREKLFKNLGSKIKNAHDYIVAVTDGATGTLHDAAKAAKYQMFVVPDDIGGRYSTITPVGLFVFVLAGLDINKVLSGAAAAKKVFSSKDLCKNDAYLYAAYRHYYHIKQKKQVENFVVYNPAFSFIGEQWKQLFGESEGKKNKAMFPVLSIFTTDLHALGQYLQEGNKNFIETTFNVKKPKVDIKIDIKTVDDKITHLDKKTLNQLNDIAFKSTIEAHTYDGQVPNLIIDVDTNDEFHYGYMFMFLAYSAMMSGYLLKINPFDQPGVEAYKGRMKALLAK